MSARAPRGTGRTQRRRHKEAFSWIAFKEWLHWFRSTSQIRRTDRLRSLRKSIARRAQRGCRYRSCSPTVEDAYSFSWPDMVPRYTLLLVTPVDVLYVHDRFTWQLCPLRMICPPSCCWRDCPRANMQRYNAATMPIIRARNRVEEYAARARYFPAATCPPEAQKRRRESRATLWISYPSPMG